MKSYVSHSGKPFGVTGYESGDDFIIVQFRNGTRYKYSYNSCGAEHVERMKALAEQQEGLSTYVAQHKSDLQHESKW